LDGASCVGEVGELVAAAFAGLDPEGSLGAGGVGPALGAAGARADGAFDAGGAAFDSSARMSKEKPASDVSDAAQSKRVGRMGPNDDGILCDSDKQMSKGRARLSESRLFTAKLRLFLLGESR
jgi:hypothetical protein